MRCREPDGERLHRPCERRRQGRRRSPRPCRSRPGSPDFRPQKLGPLRRGPPAADRSEPGGRSAGMRGICGGGRRLSAGRQPRIRVPPYQPPAWATVLHRSDGRRAREAVSRPHPPHSPAHTACARPRRGRRGGTASRRGGTPGDPARQEAGIRALPCDPFRQRSTAGRACREDRRHPARGRHHRRHAGHPDPACSSFDSWMYL